MEFSKMVDFCRCRMRTTHLVMGCELVDQSWWEFWDILGMSATTAVSTIWSLLFLLDISILRLAGIGTSIIYSSLQAYSLRSLRILVYILCIWYTGDAFIMHPTTFIAASLAGVLPLATAMVQSTPVNLTYTSTIGKSYPSLAANYWYRSITKRIH